MDEFDAIVAGIAGPGGPLRGPNRQLCRRRWQQHPAAFRLLTEAVVAEEAENPVGLLVWRVKHIWEASVAMAAAEEKPTSRPTGTNLGASLDGPSPDLICRELGESGCTHGGCAGLSRCQYDDREAS